MGDTEILLMLETREAKAAWAWAKEKWDTTEGKEGSFVYASEVDSIVSILELSIPLTLKDHIPESEIPVVAWKIIGDALRSHAERFWGEPLEMWSINN